MRRLSQSLITTSIALAVAAPQGIAAECSRADIDRYLDRGYSLAKITRLCSEDAPRAQSTPGGDNSNDVDPATAVYLQTAIDADEVKITPDRIELIQDRCFPYGEEGYGDIRPSACVTRTVAIARQGLKIGEVVEARFLIREGVLMAHGDIRQTFSDTGKLRKRELRELKQQYPEKLEKFNVPVKPGMKRKKVAEALEKLAK